MLPGMGVVGGLDHLFLWPPLPVLNYPKDLVLNLSLDL